jgi:peptide/nickel transport system substrate-binding protein
MWSPSGFLEVIEQATAIYRGVVPLVVLCTLIGGPGCADPRAGTAEATVSIMMPLDEYGLSWHWSSQAQFLVFSPLVARNAEGELEPRLAASWEHSPDYREWTVRLNTKARWHDGVPVTAGDVKYTLDLLAREGGVPGSGAYAVSVLDDSTYSIRYERPGIGNPLDDFTVIYPRHLLEDLDQERWGEWEFWKKPVGSGPFRHVRTVEGVGFEFEANPDYFRGRPRIDRVVLKFGVPQLQHLQSGEVDVLPNVTELMMMQLEQDERFSGYRWNNPIRIKTLLWNHRSPLFEDARVRRALALAIDRHELRTAVGLPDGLPVFDALYSDNQFRRGDVPGAVPYDTTEAASLLETAGWRDRDGDGVRERAGRSFRFTIHFSGGGGSWGARGGEAAALFVQNALRPLGIDVRLQPLEGAVWRDRVQSGEIEAGIEDLAGLATRFWVFGEESQLGYVKPRVVTLLRRIESAFDPDSVDFFYDEIATIFAKDHPVLFLYPAVSMTIAHRRLRGLSTPYRADAVWYLEDLWIEEEE